MDPELDKVPAFCRALFSNLNDSIVLSQLPHLPRGLLEPAKAIVALAKIKAIDSVEMMGLKLTGDLSIFGVGGSTLSLSNDILEDARAFLVEIDDISVDDIRANPQRFAKFTEILASSIMAIVGYEGLKWPQGMTARDYAVRVLYNAIQRASEASGFDIVILERAIKAELSFQSPRAAVEGGSILNEFRMANRKILAGQLKGIVEGSTYGGFEYVAALLQGGPAIGYDTIARWFDKNPNKICSYLNVVLFVEAIVAGIPNEVFSKRFPHARSEAQYSIDHAKSYAGRLMDGQLLGTLNQLLLQFYANPARTDKGLPTDPQCEGTAARSSPKT